MFEAKVQDNTSAVCLCVGWLNKLVLNNVLLVLQLTCPAKISEVFSIVTNQWARQGIMV